MSEPLISLLIPARNAGHCLPHTLKTAHAFLSQHFPNQFEIVLIPNPDPHPKAGTPTDSTQTVAEKLTAQFSATRVVPHLIPPGKGAALKTGYLASRGRWIFFTDADLPYELEFFLRAAEKLKSGYAFVTGNRRLFVSHFQVPVDLLRIAYRRHRLGMFFNQVVRLFFPIHTSDSQAGIKAMTREMASIGFEAQICPGFFFDIEFFLCAQGHHLPHIELPVTLHLNSEKSTVRILRESVQAVKWLFAIALNSKRDGYRKKALTSSAAPRAIRPLKLYPKASFGTRLFLILRWLLTPYLKMGQYVPFEGSILDLGCGHGLLSIALALQGPKRSILGIDHDEARVELAKRAARTLPSVELQVGGFQDLPKDRLFNGITLIDVMHYFDRPTQEQWLKNAYDRLNPGGVLLVREVEPSAGLASAWNQLYEKIATVTGFTRSERLDLHFRTTLEWETALRNIGFRVRSEPCSSFIFSDILFIAERPL